MYFCFVLAKKRMQRQANGQSRLRVLEHQRIEQKLSVSLIAVDNEVILLAAGPQGIALERLARTDRATSLCVTDNVMPTQIH